MSSVTAKKAKTTANANAEEFAQVRNYLLTCPFASPEHPAIQAALKGVDEEFKRRERDEKLRSKFMQDAVTVEKPVEKELVVPSDSLKTPQENRRPCDEAMSDDWHDVAEGSPMNDVQQNDSTSDSFSFLGQRLAKAAVSTIAYESVRCKTPLEALALALHAALTSDTLGFSCTGLPETKSSRSGFAAPIRELPRSQFLPDGWNKASDEIALRYVKNGLGASVLKVKLQPEAETESVVVSVTRANSSEPDGLVFELQDHINLDSWKRAARESALISPSLHFKALATLLTNFTKTFDLGVVPDEEKPPLVQEIRQEFPYTDSTVSNLPTRQGGVRADGVSIPQRPSLQTSSDPRNGLVPTTLDEAFPGIQNARVPGGDFAGDLAPGGLHGPNFGQMGPGSLSGNLMGPHNPAFFGGRAPPAPGLGMHPRYDPIGPPGGPMDPDNGGLGRNMPRGKARNRPGEPNPDHLRPPSNLSDNMFW